VYYLTLALHYLGTTLQSTLILVHQALLAHAPSYNQIILCHRRIISSVPHV
jgi:hypothetical protein